jgi:hypothetical protein
MSAQGLLEANYQLLQGSDMLHSLSGDKAEQILFAEVVVALGAEGVESGIEEMFSAMARSGLPKERAMEIGKMAMELAQSRNGACMSTCDPRPFAEVYGSDGAEQRRTLRNKRRERRRRSSQGQQDVE